MPAGRPPKPEGQKVNRAKMISHDFLDLPAEGRGDLPVPPLPQLMPWQCATLEWWAKLWAKPQAVMWDEEDTSLWRLAILFDQNMIGGHEMTSALAGEMRRIEDGHGLTPSGLRMMHWRLSAPIEHGEQDVRPASVVVTLDDRRRRLQVV